MLTILRNRPRAGVLHFIGLFGYPTLYSPPHHQVAGNCGVVRFFGFKYRYLF